MFIQITHTVDVYRLSLVGGKEAYGVSPVLTGIRIGIFPAGVDIQAVYPGIPAFQLYDGYTEDSSTLKNGDKLKQGSDEFIIRGTPQVFTSPLSYQRVALEKVSGT